VPGPVLWEYASLRKKTTKFHSRPEEPRTDEAYKKSEQFFEVILGLYVRCGSFLARIQLQQERGKGPMLAMGAPAGTPFTAGARHFALSSVNRCELTPYLVSSLPSRAVSTPDNGENELLTWGRNTRLGKGGSMPGRSFLGVVLSAAIAYQPALAAPPTLGQAIIKGQARINGVATPSGTSLFAGDRVATSTDSIAQLQLTKGGNVFLPASSVVVLEPEGDPVTLGLEQGALAVLSKNSSPLTVEANGVRILAPTDSAAVIEVAITGNSLKVLARRGKAIVESADRTIEVPEGKELDATVASAPKQGPSEAKPAGRNRLETWVLVIAVAAGLTGLILGIMAVTRPNPAGCIVVSPSGVGSIRCP